MKDVVFAIPSYQRADRQLAVRWLSRLGYKPSEIFVAVQNDADRAAYSEALRGVATVFGQNGVGVSFNRNQCLSVRPDARLVMVDDGVHGVSVKTPQGKCESVKARERLDAMLSLMFDFAERNRVNVFSLNPSSNGLCASSKDFINHLLVNTFMGIVDRRTLFNVSMSCNEDTERNARIVKGGGGLIASRMPSRTSPTVLQADSTRTTRERFRKGRRLLSQGNSQILSLFRETEAERLHLFSTGTDTRSERLAFCLGKYKKEVIQDGLLWK